MQYTQLGATGLEVSRISLGMMSYGSPTWQPWVLPANEATAFVRQALELGVNAFDTADFYSYGASEEALGTAIQSLTDRHSVVIATKVGLPMGPGPNRGGLSRKHILSSIDASLRRLKTDYIDLYQLHRFDPQTPIEETMDALESVVRAGKARYVGASNFSTWQLAPAVFAKAVRAGARLASMQIQYNLLYREEERDMIPFCRSQGIGLMVYSPLARGWLAGNHANQAKVTERELIRSKHDGKAAALYGSGADRAVVERVLEVAKTRDLSPARLAMSWLHARPGINTLVCGALEPRHLDEAAAAVDLKLTAEENAFLEELYCAGFVKDDAFGAVIASSAAKA